MQLSVITDRSEDLISSLTELWERSVRATHDFLSEAEINKIKLYVPDAFRHVPSLTVAKDETGALLGFIGTADHRIEMLFVEPNCRGQGIGKKLLLFLMSALEEKGFERVSLSVQKSNPAVRLYQRTGFITVDETEEEYIMVNNLTMSADGAAVKRRGK